MNCYPILLSVCILFTLISSGKRVDSSKIKLCVSIVNKKINSHNYSM